MIYNYSNLLSTCASEKKAGYHLLTERHVQALWLEQKYFKGLQTLQGESIEVLSPGAWNLESGPDFLKAHLRIGSQELRGDIEIHLDEEGWNHHHHQKDARYNDVILHLVLWSKPTSKSIFKENGQGVRTAYLDMALTVSLHRLVQLIDLDLYPYKKFLGSGKCSQLLFKRLPDTEIISLFSSAAFWRLEQKKKYLQARLLTHSLQLAGGMAMALGYKHNAEAFLDLFLFLLDFRDLPFEELLAIGMGSCGFFEKSSRSHWEKSPYYQFLKLIWEAQKSEVLQQTQLRLDHIRPLNHPVRRLVYLAKLLHDSHLEEYWQIISQWWMNTFPLIETSKKLFVQLRQSLINLIPVYEESYWNSHYTFELEAKKDFLPLMGEDLKIEILVNTVFPLLFAEIQERGEVNELNAFQLFYGTFKASNTSKTKYLTHRFFGETLKGTLLEKAQMEQGAYQLHKDFCVHFEASCEGCPFIERYESFRSLT